MRPPGPLGVADWLSVTEAHEGQEGSAADAVDADQATASTPGETDTPTPEPVVGTNRGANDATVVVHKPGTRPPDISDIIGGGATDATADGAEGEAPAGDGEAGEATAPDDAAPDLNDLPPPAAPVAPETPMAASDTPADGTPGAPTAPEAAAPPAAEPVLPLPGSNPFDDRTVEMPAGGDVDAILRGDLSTSPVPTGAPPPPPTAATIVDGSATTPQPPPPPTTDESSEAAEAAPVPPPPPPPAGTPPIGTPPAPTTDDGPETASPVVEPPVGPMAGLDDGPVSIDNNPTTMVSAVDATQAPPPPPGAPAFEEATATGPDPTDLDEASTAADGPLAAPPAGPTESGARDDVTPGAEPNPDDVDIAGAPPVGLKPETSDEPPLGDTPAPPPPPMDASATVEMTPEDAAASADFGATVQIPIPDLPGNSPDPGATVQIKPEDLDPGLGGAGGEAPDAPGPSAPGPVSEATIAAPPPPPADETAIAGFTPVNPPEQTDDPPAPPAAADGATMVSPSATPDIGATQAIDAATAIAPAAPEIGAEPALDQATAAAAAGVTSIAGPPDTPLSPPPGTGDGIGPIGTDPGGDPADGEKRSGRRRGPLLALAAILGLILLVVAAWLIDSARTDGQVARGTVFGTTPIGGLDAAELETLADQLDEGLAATDVTLTVGDDSVQRDAAALGALIDRTHLTEEAFEARQGGFVLMRPIRWVGTFFTEEQIEPQYVVDLAAASSTVDDINANDLPQPLEPDLAFSGDEFTVVDGQPGVQIAADEVVSALPDELAGDGPFSIDITANDATPRFSNDEIAAVATEITAATSGPLNFQVLDQTAEIDGSALRSWVVLDTTGSQPEWRIDEIVALDELRPLFPTLGSEDQQARFSVVDGEPIIIPASETVICCTTESLTSIRSQFDEALPEPGEDADTDENGEPILPARVISVEPEVVGSDEGVKELESLGIIEEVSTFTTEHACCQNRVTNIQRFADLMRGVVIRPGEELSLNGHVGRRTIENGFVADSAIANGILEPQVGGGVSQFATTFFNAAFYAGIDFNEYQSHSLYISRYPRGREATISFPAPDLSVTNTTDYGILVWTEYTPTSITVTFYSTKHIEVEDLPLVRSSNGQCSVFTTPRVRTYPDGEVVEDSVFALYRPGEGLDCNGNSTVPEEPEGPTVIAPDEVTEPIVDPVPGPDPTPDPDPAPAPDPGLPPAPDPDPPPGG